MTGTAQPAVGEPLHGGISAVRRWAIVGLLGLGMVIAFVDRANLSVALAVDDFKAYFGLSDLARGALNSAFFWSYALLQLPVGWVVDRYGVGRPYAIALTAWSFAAASVALAGSFAQLIALRVVLGVAEAVVAPASLRWIKCHIGERRRGLALGIYAAGTKLGPAIGTPLAAWLVVALGWREMFVLLGCGGLLFLVPWLALVRGRAADALPDPPSPSARPVSLREVAASPAIWGILIGSFCYGYFVYFCMTWLPAYFVEGRNLSLTSMGFFTFLSFGGLGVMATFSGWLADRIIARGGEAVKVRKGFTIAGLLLASMEVATGWTDSQALALVIVTLSVSGLGLATANYWALTQSIVPHAVIGRVSGAQNCAVNLAGIAAPLLTGWLKDRSGGYDLPMQVIWLVLLIGVGAFRFLVRDNAGAQAACGGGRAGLRK